MYNKEQSNRSSAVLLIGLSILTGASRYFLDFTIASSVLALCIMIAMLWGNISYERKNQKAADGFAVMTTGIVYFGWIGSYLITLRQSENGFWWVIICLLLVWLSDTGAFFVGSKFGKHQMAPLVSPHKTWEGYFGGVLSTLVIGILLFLIIPPVSKILKFPQMILLALLIGLITPFGDLGESMIKRTFGFKDSSNLIPGHGGIFDRMDTVFWTMVIGYSVYTLINLGLI